MGGSSFINVVPPEAWAKVCVRAPETQAAEDLRREILALQPFDPDVALMISGEVNRPVFERSEGIAPLYALARCICRDLEFDIPERASGSSSDGNFTAALAVPTLDGWGADGNNHHTPNEYVHASCLVPRVQTWMRLRKTLE
jgi:glutamate carboxypeptidase